MDIISTAINHFEYGISHDIFKEPVTSYARAAVDALRAQQEHFCDSTKMVAPLTLDELRKMDGEPVWVVYDEDAGMWALVEVCEESIFLTNNLGGRTEYAADVELEDDDITVYRQKPEEDDHES